MKSILKRTLTIAAAFTVALALFNTLPPELRAQEKGATKLIKLNTPPAPSTPAMAASKPMSCANCKESFVTVRDTDSRGGGAKALLAGGPPTKVVAKHLCNTCGNRWAVKGVGKAKISVPIHTCVACR